MWIPENFKNKNMKTIFICFIVLISGCASHYPSNYKNASDKQLLIYEILNNALSDKSSEIARESRCSKLIYINKMYASKFMAGTNDDYKEFPLEATDIPDEINGVKFILKTKEELQAMADSQKGNIYSIMLGQIEIKGDSATIGMDERYTIPTDPKKTYMGGGGRLLNFKKVNGIWVMGKSRMLWTS
jgi:hypothetical protein